MNEVVKKFKVVIPAQLTKSDDGDWIVQGLASTPSRDQQGEIILPDGIDATPIDQGRGVINWDHQKGPENTLGLLDTYSKTKSGFFVKGRLFKNHSKAKAVYEIMSSLGKSDQGRMGLSVEGKILERGGKDGKIIKKCQINAVALTMNPVNQDSYVDLVKSLTAEEAEVDFQATEENALATGRDATPVFTAEQVAAIVKSLCLTDAQATAKPADRSGGDALAREELDKKPKSIAEDSGKPSKKFKKLSKDMYKSSMLEMLDKIHGLYPNSSKVEIWMAIKDRLSKRFPYLQRNDD